MPDTILVDDIENCEIREILFPVTKCFLPFFVDEQEMAIRRNTLDQVICILEVVIPLLLFGEGQEGPPHPDELPDDMDKLLIEGLWVTFFPDIKIGPVV